jgi:hypothetical protein
MEVWQLRRRHRSGGFISRCEEIQRLDFEFEFATTTTRHNNQTFFRWGDTTTAHFLLQ